MGAWANFTSAVLAKQYGDGSIRKINVKFRYAELGKEA
jgi:hypothetical protein